MALWHTAAQGIASPLGTILLLVAGCLLLYHDLLTPMTWGLSGTVGLVGVGLVFAAHLAVGTGGYLGVILLLVGLGAILFEIHVKPGRGSALGGFILMYLGMFQALGGMRHAAFALITTTCLIIAAGLAFLAYLPKSPAWRRVGAQLRSHSDLRRNLPQAWEKVVGRSGLALTALCPTGFADIDGLRLRVVTEGEFIEAGAAILVTEIEDGRVIVHEVSAPQTSALAA